MKKLDFLPRLESLRGIAALTVVGYHVCGQLSGGKVAGPFDALASSVLLTLSNGIGAVVTFFVLSGFVLARSLERNPDPVKFLRNRVFRLFPAAMAVVALLTAVHWQFGIFVGYEPSFDAFNVILNMLMIRNDINGVMWSMTVECAATPLIFASVWLFRTYGQRPLYILIATLFALSFWGTYVHLLGGFTNLAPFYAFVVGVLLHFRGDRISGINVKAAILVGCLAISLFYFCGAKKQTAPVLMLECASAAALIGLLAYRPKTNLFKPLDWASIQFYDRISYSFYLLHPLGILFAFRIFDPSSLNASGMPLSLSIVFATLSSIVLTTPMAWLNWRLVEVPATQIGRSLEKPPVLLLDQDPPMRHL